MISKWAYILIGNNDTGKTSFQKWVIWHLCKVDKFTKLNMNLIHQINHRDSPRKLKTLFTINRSIQEKMGESYESIDDYFHRLFQDADVAILSSHSSQHLPDIEQMMDHLNRRYYNVCAVFFSNHLNFDTQQIALLNWNEKIVINNPENNENWERQIEEGANFFANMIIRKANQY